MIERILVPLDSSELAETALPYAQEIASESGHITLLMVIEPPTTYIDEHGTRLTTEGTMQEQKVKLGQAQMYLDTIEARLTNMKGHVKNVIKFGDPPTQIIELAEADSIDAIVMSTHGRTGLSRWLLGSVTHKVVSVAPCPVFVIPRKE